MDSKESQKRRQFENRSNKAETYGQEGKVMDKATNLRTDKAGQNRRTDGWKKAQKYADRIDGTCSSAEYEVD